MFINRIPNRAVTSGAFTTFTSQYPPAYNSTYVKATGSYGSSYEPFLTTDPSKSLTGSFAGAQWVVSGASQRFHIDLGSAKQIDRIYYENSHYYGVSYINDGMRAFTFWGSNNATAFATLTYATDTNWTQLTTVASEFDKHIAADQADPKFTLVTVTGSYRYWAFKFATTWGATLNSGVRRIELQTGS